MTSSMRRTWCFARGKALLGNRQPRYFVLGRYRGPKWRQYFISRKSLLRERGVRGQQHILNQTTRASFLTHYYPWMRTGNSTEELERESEREENLCYLGIQCEVQGSGHCGQGNLIWLTEEKICKKRWQEERNRERFSSQVVGRHCAEYFHVPFHLLLTFNLRHTLYFIYHIYYCLSPSLVYKF